MQISLEDRYKIYIRNELETPSSFKAHTHAQITLVCDLIEIFTVHKNSRVASSNSLINNLGHLTHGVNIAELEITYFINESRPAKERERESSRFLHCETREDFVNHSPQMSSSQDTLEDRYP